MHDGHILCTSAQQQRGTTQFLQHIPFVTHRKSYCALQQQLTALPCCRQTSQGANVAEHLLLLPHQTPYLARTLCTEASSKSTKALHVIMYCRPRVQCCFCVSLLDTSFRIYILHCVSSLLETQRHQVAPVNHLLPLMSQASARQHGGRLTQPDSRAGDGNAPLRRPREARPCRCVMIQPAGPYLHCIRGN
jgi:hypothetical protein